MELNIFCNQFVHFKGSESTVHKTIRSQETLDHIEFSYSLTEHVLQKAELIRSVIFLTLGKALYSLGHVEGKKNFFRESVDPNKCQSFDKISSNKRSGDYR